MTESPTRGSMSKCLQTKDCSKAPGKAVEPSVPMDGFITVKRRRRRRSSQGLAQIEVQVEETETTSTHHVGDALAINMNADLAINADLPMFPANFRKAREQERQHVIQNQNRELAKLRKHNEKLRRRLMNKGRRGNSKSSPGKEYPEGWFSSPPGDDSGDSNRSKPAVSFQTGLHPGEPAPSFIYAQECPQQSSLPVDEDPAYSFCFPPSEQRIDFPSSEANDALISQIRADYLDAQSMLEDESIPFSERMSSYLLRVREFWSRENCSRIARRYQSHVSSLQVYLNQAVGVSIQDVDSLYAPIVESFKSKKDLMYQMCIRVIMYCVALQSCRTVKDVVTTTIGVCGQHLTYEHISSLLEYVYPEGLFDDFALKLSKFRSMALCIEEVPCYDMLKKGLSLCVFFGMKPTNMVVSGDMMHSFVRKFEKDVSRGFGVHKLVDAVLSLGDYTANAIACLRAGGDLSRFLLPSNLHSRYADIVSTFTLIENGTYQRETSDNLDSFDRLVKELAKEVEISLTGNGLTPHFKTVYTEYLKNLKNMINKLHILKQNASYRVKPYCVSFFGKSQIGKSMATNMLIRTYGAVRGDIVDTREIYYHSEAAKHQTGFTNDKRVYVLDDMDTIRQDKSSYTTSMISTVIHNVNNVPSMINHADISQKGVNFERNELTVMTTNCLDLDIHEKVVYGPAAANRINFVEVILDPDYAHPDGTLDYTKLTYEDDIPHAHHFIQRYNIEFTGFDNKTKKPTTWHKKESGPPIPFAQWLRETASEMKKHYAHQEHYLKEMAAIQSVQCCNKCWMPVKAGYCVCPPAVMTTIPEADRHFDQFFANPRVSAIMGFFNVWEGLLVPIGNHFVEQFILKTTLFLVVVAFRAFTGMQVDAAPYYLLTVLMLWGLREHLYLFANPFTLSLIMFSLILWTALALKGLLKIYKAHIRKEIHSAAVGHSAYMASILGITTLCSAAAAIKVIQTLMATTEPEGNLIPQTMEEVQTRHEEKNEWLEPSRVPLPAPIQLKTMTRDQVIKKLQNNCVYFTAISPKGIEYTRGTMWLVDAGHVMLPHHTFELMQKETPSPWCVTILRGKDSRQSVMTYIMNPAPVKCRREKTLKDFVVFQSTKHFPVQSISKYLPETNPLEVVCDMMTVNENLDYRIQTVKYSPLNGMTNGSSCIGTRVSQRGSRHNLQVPTKSGDCLAPLIAHSNPHEIVAFHIGAREEPLRSKKGIAFELLKEELEDAIARTRGSYIVEPQEEKITDWPEGVDNPLYQPTASLEEVHIYDCDGKLAFHVGDYHERSNARYIRIDSSSDTPSVDFVGEDSSLRHKTFSSVSRTFLSSYLERVGSPCKWRPPNFESNRNHATYLEIGIRPMRDIDPHMLNRAQLDYLSVVPSLIARTNWPESSPITLDEAMNGIDQSRFIHSIKDDTSGGFGFKGKKHRHMETWYRESDGKKMFTPLPHLCEGVERILQALAKGQMSCPIVKTALKDEPTLKPEYNSGKDKVRVFSVYPMDFFLVGKMLFSPVLEFLQSFPLELELLQGINVTTDEWEQIGAHILDFEPSAIIEGDFSKMDVRLSGQIIRASGACLIEMARMLGYSELSLRQMESYICDIALTSWSYAGLMMLLDGWNTSGNYLTIVINGLALALLHRTAYLEYAVSMLCRSQVPSFRSHIRMGFVGDDSLGSSKLKWYNMKYLQQYFGSVGMIYTDGRKSPIVPAFIEASEASLCKRKFRFEPRAGMRVAPIDLDSLYKSLHCMMKSATEETTIVTGNVDQVLRELCRHSEEVFSRERETILKACERAGILHLIKYASRSYDDWWQDILKRLPPIVEGGPFDEFVECHPTPIQVHRSVTSRPRVERVAPPSSDSKRGFCQSLLRLCWQLIWLYMLLRTFGALVPAKAFSGASEFKNMSLGSETQKEVMSFGDQKPHWVVGMNSQEERSAYAGSTTDTNDGFLFRPLKIYSAQWTPGVDIFDTIDPWSLFFEDPRVINRVVHFRNMRSSLKLKFLINGNPFYYGRCMAAYQPLPEIDGVTVFRAGVVEDLVEASQRLHILMNPTLSEGGEMTLPFIYPKNYVVIPEREWNKLGRITLTSFNTLRHANGSTKPVTITVLAHCEPDLDLSLPTSIVPVDTVPQGFEYPEGDEYGMISGAAHTVANWAGKLSVVPEIAPYARATEMAANIVGGVASIFGFSRPRVVDENQIVVARMHGTTAVTNEPDTARTLALDSKKEVTIDPRVTNATVTDEMAVVPLAKRESFLTKFLWEKTDGQDTSLFQARVGPIQGVREGLDAHITPACFVSAPFNYWTGSMEYRIQVVASGMHRGRLRIAWDPFHFDLNKFNVYNVNYSKIVDISECTDLTFKVGWGQETNYTLVPEINDLPNFIKKGAAIGNLDGPKDGYNGVFGIFVVNSLTSPSDDPNPVEVNIFTRACDDFEVCSPTKLQTLKFKPIITPAIVIPRAETVMPARRYQGAPHRVMFKQDHPANADPYLVNSGIDSGHAYQFFNGSSNNEFLVYSPQGGNVPVVFIVTAVVTDVSCTINLAGPGGIDTQTLLVESGTTQFFNLTALDLAPGVNYIDLEFVNDVTGLRLLEVQTNIPANWKSQYTSAADIIDSDMTQEVFNDLTFLRSNTAFPDPAIKYAVFEMFDTSAAVGSRFTTTARDGIKLNGFQYWNETGAEFTINHQFWAPVVEDAFPAFAEPTNHFNDPWIPTWGSFWWFSNDPNYPEGNCLRKMVEPPPPPNIMLEDEIVLQEIINDLENTVTTPQHRRLPTEYPEGDDVLATNTTNTVDAENMNAPETQQVDTTMGPASPGGANQVYFGEQVGSIRQMLKRYEGDLAVRFNANGAYRFDIAQYPMLNASGTVGNLEVRKQTADLIDWFMPAFVCVRGSMRVKIFGCYGDNRNINVCIATRISANEVLEANAPEFALATVDEYRCFWSGTEYAHMGAQGEGSLEFEIPWYSRYRFTPARSINNTDVENHIERDWCRVVTRAAVNTVYHIAYAIGEDFSLTNFLSTPIMTPTL